MIIVAKPKAGEGAAHETIQAAVKAAVEAIKRAIKEGA
jgi:pectin methylesterase-like acyl-CoA thioesterase